MNKKKTYPPASGTLDETIIKALKEDEGFRREYLKDLFQEEDAKLVAISLRPLVEAMGGIGKISKATGLGRQSLYKSLSGKVRPDFQTILKIVNYAGYDLSVDKCKDSKHHARALAFAH
jgi:probable addiction module antidote protein